MKKHLYILTIIICLLGWNCSGPNHRHQTLQTYEDFLYSECLKDTSESAEDGFFYAFHEESFRDLIKSDTSSMTYPFEKLQEVGCVYTNTSKDGNLRIYQWNYYGITTELGNISYLCKYKTKDGKVKTIDDLFDLLEPSKDDESLGFQNLNNIREICSVVDKDGNTIYVLDFFGRTDVQCGRHLITAFSIGNDSISEYKAFENGRSYLSVEYAGISDWVDRTGRLGWEWVNSYDKENKAIYVPHFTYTEIMFDRYDVYQFDGKIFKYIRTDGGFWLNPELRDFVELKTIVNTDSYVIRVDAVGDGMYRYTSWRKGKTMLEQPDLEIYSNIYNEEEHCFIFDNDEYTYIVDDGIENDSYKKGLIVKHNGKVILRQNRRF